MRQSSEGEFAPTDLALSVLERTLLASWSAFCAVVVFGGKRRPHSGSCACDCRLARAALCPYSRESPSCRS